MRFLLHLLLILVLALNLDPGPRPGRGAGPVVGRGRAAARARAGSVVEAGNGAPVTGLRARPGGWRPVRDQGSSQVLGAVAFAPQSDSVRRADARGAGQRWRAAVPASRAR